MSNLEIRFLKACRLPLLIREWGRVYIIAIDLIILRKSASMCPSSLLFQPFQFTKGIELRNRAVMAPMTTWSGNADGTVADEEVSYYRERVKGVGLVITGCSHVQPNGIGFTDEFACYDDRFIPSLSKLAKAAKSGGAPAILQIFHAGNKAVPSLIPNGTVVAPSAILPSAAEQGEGSVHALAHDEILDIVEAFGRATRRAIEAGFDGVELHGAHGFLLQNFVSPHFNRRDDLWGGNLENRLRFPIAVLNEVMRVAEDYARRPFLVGYRVSPDEPEAEGLRIADTMALIEALIAAKIDYLHISLPDLLNARPVDQIGGPTTAAILLNRVGGRVPVIAAGQIEDPKQAEEAVREGLSLVAIGRGIVTNPRWVELSQEGLSDQLQTHLAPERLPDLAIPAKLWNAIQQRPGWFKTT